MQKHAFLLICLAFRGHGQRSRHLDTLPQSSELAHRKQKVPWARETQPFLHWHDALKALATLLLKVDAPLLFTAFVAPMSRLDFSFIRGSRSRRDANFPVIMDDEPDPTLPDAESLRSQKGRAIGAAEAFSILSAAEIRSSSALEESWAKAYGLMKDNATAKCEVLSVDSDGATLELEGLRASLPKNFLTGSLKLTEALVGRMLPCRVIRADRDANELVVTSTEAVFQMTLADLEQGYVVEGTVVSLQDFGALVDIGIRKPALLHITQITATTPLDVRDIFSEGDKIKALVYSIDQQKASVTLNTKVLEPSPGDMIANREIVSEMAEEMGANYRRRWRKLQPQDVVTGEVVSVVNVGAFVEIGIGKPAWLHKSQISGEHVSNVSEVLKEGDVIKAMVYDKSSRGAITLSTKHLEPSPGDMIIAPELVFDSAEYMGKLYRRRYYEQAGRYVQGKVVVIREFGALIDVGVGRPALLHRSQITSASISNVRDVLTEGDTVRAVVLDKAAGRVTLSTKLLEPYPGDMLKDPQAVYENAEEAAASYWNRWDSLEWGRVVEGEVVGVTDFGIFVELGTPKPALLHVSQITSANITSPKDYFSVGRRIKAMVLDKTSNKITLNTKYLEPSPGDMLRDPDMVYDRAEEMSNEYMEQWEWGKVVQGEVRVITSYGARVDVGSGKLALLHISQISCILVRNVRAVLSEGDKIKAFVFSVDRASGRIALSTKVLERMPGDMLLNQKQVFDKAEETGELYRIRNVFQKVKNSFSKPRSSW